MDSRADTQRLCTNFDVHRPVRIIRVPSFTSLLDPNFPYASLDISDNYYKSLGTEKTGNLDTTTQKLSSGSTNIWRSRRKLLQMWPSGIETDDEELDFASTIARRATQSESSNIKSNIPVPKISQCSDLRASIYGQLSRRSRAIQLYRGCRQLELNYKFDYDVDDDDVTWIDVNFPNSPSFTYDFFEYIISQLECSSARNSEIPNHMQTRKVIDLIIGDQTLSRMHGGSEILTKFVTSVCEYWIVKRKQKKCLIPRLKYGTHEKAKNNESVFTVFKNRCNLTHKNRRKLKTNEEKQRMHNLVDILDRAMVQFGAILKQTEQKSKTIDLLKDLHTYRYKRLCTRVNPLVAKSEEIEVSHLLSQDLRQYAKRCSLEWKNNLATSRNEDEKYNSMLDKYLRALIPSQVNKLCDDGSKKEVELNTRGLGIMTGPEERVQATTKASCYKQPNPQTLKSTKKKSTYKRKASKSRVRKKLSKSEQKKVKSRIKELEKKTAAKSTRRKPQKTQYPKEIEKEETLNGEDITFVPKLGCEYHSEVTNLLDDDFDCPFSPYDVFYPTTIITGTKAVYAGIVRRRIDMYGKIVVDLYAGGANEMIGPPIQITIENDVQNRICEEENIQGKPKVDQTLDYEL